MKQENKQAKETKKNTKKQPWTLKAIKHIKRSDGLRPKRVTEFTMRSVLECADGRYGKYLALTNYDDESGENAFTYHQMLVCSQRIGLFLMDQGFQKGDRIALMGEGCSQWMVAYFGITTAGFTAVPILPEFTAKDVVNIIRESQAKATIVNVKHFEKCLPLVGTGHRFIRLDDLFEIPDESRFLSDKKTFASAPGNALRAFKAPKDGKKVWAEHAPNEDDIASLIFTSGTTGQSKGVLLSHKNLVWNADVCTDFFFDVKKRYRILSFLPLSHVYEFTTSQLLGILCGCEIHYLCKPAAPSFLMPALASVRPQIMMSVPLLIEKVYRSAVKPILEKNKKLQPWLKWSVSRKFICRIACRKLKLSFGGKLRFFGIGGAPLDPQVEKFLLEAKFPYAQGYGLTETSPMICGHGPKDHHFGYLGKVITGEELRLENKNSDGVGEILIKGPNVMQGYIDNDALNKESFTEDGFFRTGDLGKLDKHGRLGLRGRTKTMILGSGGENIYPETIESLINSQDFVTESLVVPEDGGLLALVKLDLDSFAKSLSMDVNDAKAEAAKYIAKVKQNINKELSSSSKISSVELQEEPFQRTPTMKIKRFLYGIKKNNEEKTDESKEKESDKKDR